MIDSATVDLQLAHLYAFFSCLFVATGMYYELRHGDKVSNYATGAVASLGVVIFVALNYRYYIESDTWMTVAGIILAVMLFVTWVLATLALHVAVVVDDV